MVGEIIVGIVVIAVLALAAYGHYIERDTSSYRQATGADPRPHVICPHCGTKGKVHTTPTKTKQGISGGKATAGIMTGGASLLATGLSRKVPTTAMRCGHCGMSWTA